MAKERGVSDLNDTELGRRFAEGGEPELEEVMNAYGEKLLRYATSILCDYHESEDAVQNVFIAAYQNRRKFDGEYLSAWLYKITYNHCVKQLKKRKFLFFSDLGGIPEEITNPIEDSAISEEILEKLRLLKAEDRALLYGKIMEGQSYDELSIIFRKSPAALRKQYERAKKKLAGYLSDEMDFMERNQKNEFRYEQV